MLVLTRKRGQSFFINGRKIEVEVLDISGASLGSQVKIGIKAPRDTSINRSEIQDKIDQGIPKEISNSNRSIRDILRPIAAKFC